MGRHDSGYKALFSYPYLVECLIRGFVPGDWIGRLDFKSLETVSEAHPRDGTGIRYDDMIWRLRWRGSRLRVYVYLLLEFQSQDEHFMALRVLDYEVGLYRQIVRALGLKRGDLLPLVLPMVLYRGYPAWRSETEVFDLIQPAPPEIAPYQPHLKFLLLDVNAYPLVELEAMSNPVACIFWLERSPALGTAANRRSRRPAVRPRARRTAAHHRPVVDPDALAIAAAGRYRTQSEEARGGKSDDRRTRHRLDRSVAGRRSERGPEGRRGRTLAAPAPPQVRPARFGHRRPRQQNRCGTAPGVGRPGTDREHPRRSLERQRRLRVPCGLPVLPRLLLKPSPGPLRDPIELPPQDWVPTPGPPPCGGRGRDHRASRRRGGGSQVSRRPPPAGEMARSEIKFSIWPPLC